MKSRAPLPVVYLNGEFCRLEDATVSVLDRGFLYGDGIYEIIPVYAGTPLELKRHTRRLQAGLRAIRIDNPQRNAGWDGLITELIERNGGGDVSVYIQVTRGAPSYRDHAFPADTAPTVLVMCAPLARVDPALVKNGVGAVTRPDSRWARCDIKSVSLLANVLLRQDAVESGAAETILYDGDRVTEGAASSVFVVIADEIITPPDGPEILPGTTRDLIVELAQAAGLQARFGEVTLPALQGADEIWLCSSLREMLPVTSLDNMQVGNGTPGPVFSRVYKLFQEHKTRLAA